MAEDKYTWSDVIIDPTSDRAKEAIGKEVYCSDNPTTAIFDANQGRKTGILKSLEVEGRYPFTVKVRNSIYGTGSIIVKKEEQSYSERANKWIEENDLRVGDYVKVLRKAEDHEEGWGLFWLDVMNNCVGKTIRVDVVDSDEYGILLGRYRFPYFVLEKVDEEELYSEHLKRGIEDSNLKAGDYVRVTRAVDYNDEHFNAVWIDEMDHCVGKTMRVLKVDDYSGITLENLCIFPYFVLEKVKEHKSEYVPFKSAEEFISAYDNADNAIRSSTELKLSGFGMWLKCCEHYELVTYIHNNGITIDDISINWKTLFDSYTFLDGTPCGKLREESNA